MIWGRFLLIFALDKLNFRHISTSGLVDLLTYKYVMWCAPRDESFHQVWSWYDHPLPSYSVIPADTLRDLVTLTFDLLTLVSGHTGRVTWSTPPLSLKILWLYILQLWVLTSPIGYCLQPLHMRRITWPKRRGPIVPTYLKSLTQICLFTMQLLWRYD